MSNAHTCWLKVGNKVVTEDFNMATLPVPGHYFTEVKIFENDEPDSSYDEVTLVVSRIEHRINNKGVNTYIVCTMVDPENKEDFQESERLIYNQLKFHDFVGSVEVSEDYRVQVYFKESVKKLDYNQTCELNDSLNFLSRKFQLSGIKFNLFLLDNNGSTEIRLDTWGNEEIKCRGCKRYKKRKDFNDVYFHSYRECFDCIDDRIQSGNMPSTPPNPMP